MVGGRYFGTCWPGQWAPISQLLLPRFLLAMTKQRWSSSSRLLCCSKLSHFARSLVQGAQISNS